MTGGQRASPSPITGPGLDTAEPTSGVAEQLRSREAAGRTRPELAVWTDHLLVAAETPFWGRSWACLPRAHTAEPQRETPREGSAGCLGSHARLRAERAGRHGRQGSEDRRPVRKTPNPARSFRTGAKIPANDPRGCEAATREGIEPRGPDRARLEGRRALGPDTRSGGTNQPSVRNPRGGRCSRSEHNCSALYLGSVPLPGTPQGPRRCVAKSRGGRPCAQARP